MKLTPTAKLILKERYLRKTNAQLEKPTAMFRRVAQAAAGAEELFGRKNSTARTQLEEEFYHLLANLDFLPNSPTLLNAGKIDGQLAACFVLPLSSSINSIFETLKKAAIIHSYGGGTGFSFSHITPAHWLNSADNNPLGPVSYLKIFNYATNIIRQGGIRSGANMGTIAISHPDIMDFINCKSKSSDLESFNLSVAITDEFMKRVEQNELFQLQFQGKFHKKVSAKELFNYLAFHAWTNGEPGIIFIDEINRHNPTPNLGQLETTNPCGEQPLLPFEACNLGSINLMNIIAGGCINWAKLKKTINLAIRFLDNIIEINKLPIKEIENMATKNRKIGLGVMGFANVLQSLGIPYDSEKAVVLAESLMKFIQKEAHQTSILLGKERGSFPNIGESLYKNKIMRNATCTTIAPTGTISSIAGVSPGIEPSFALLYQRRILDQVILEINPVFMAKMRENYTPVQVKEVVNYLQKHGNAHGIDFLSVHDKKVFITAPEIAPIWHVKIQSAFQKYCDNAVSKTVNLPQSATVEDIEKIFIAAFKLKCKGITVYRVGSRTNEALITGCRSISQDGNEAKLWCE